MRYNILIVEDDRRTAQSLANQLKVLGHTVAISYGPRMAIQQLNQVIPDVIFMDMNMPGVNGLEVLRFLRRDPITSKVPVVIVSANDSPADFKAAAEAGANHYLIKPPMLEDIEAAINKVITIQPPTADAAPASTAPSEAAPKA
jgi:twitching motility two-component system response regulator PilH